jgi:hypothetical protein
VIKRFVDPQAEFIFLPQDKVDQAPADAIAFGLPGSEFGPRDENGTAMDKIVKKYDLAKDPGVKGVADIVSSGIEFVSRRGRGDPNMLDVPAPEGIGLNLISEGMMVLIPDDHENIEAAFTFYDALYMACRARAIQAEEGDKVPRGLPERADFLRDRLKDALPGRKVATH